MTDHQPGEIVVDDNGNVNLFIPTAMAFGEAPPPNQGLEPLNPDRDGDLNMMLNLEDADGLFGAHVADDQPVTIRWANATVTARAGTFRRWIGD